MIYRKRQTLSRWLDVAQKMTGPSSITQMLIQLGNEFLYHDFNLFFFSSQGLHSLMQMFLLFCYYQAHDVYQFPGNKRNQQKCSAIIEHIFTEINLMSLLEFHTVQL